MFYEIIFIFIKF